MNLKEKLLQLLTPKKDDGERAKADEEAKFKEAVEKRAQELLEQEIKTIDNEFLKQISERLGTIEPKTEDKKLSDAEKTKAIQDIIKGE